MNFPIAERVAQDLVGALGNVELIYGYSVRAAVKQASKLGDSPADGLTVVYVGDLRPINENLCGHDSYHQDFVIVAYALHSDAIDNGSLQTMPASQPSLNKRLAQRGAEIIAAVCADRTRGGLCQDMVFERRQRIFDNSKTGYSGVIVFVSAWFRTLMDDPYNQ